MDIRLGSNPEKISAKGGIGLLNTRLNLEIPFCLIAGASLAFRRSEFLFKLVIKT